MTVHARAIALFILVSVVTAADAQTDADGYPVKAVRFVVPYAPGGNGDIVSRIIAQRLAKATGQQVVVDNRAGAGGNIGAELAARAAPDGYTIVLGTNTHAINMSLYSKPGYDLAADFAPITLLTTAPMLLAVHPSLPAKSVKEFIALAKARPGKLNYGSGGSGTSAHIITELFKTTAGIDLVHVSYKGTAQAATDLMAGQIQVMFIATSSALNFMRSGKLVGLGVSTAKPSALAPGVTPLAQSGLPGFDASIWQGVLAPARTPARIVNVLNREIANQVDQKEVKEQFIAQGAEAMASTPERFGTFIKSEIERWGKVVKASGAKVD